MICEGYLTSPFSARQVADLTKLARGPLASGSQASAVPHRSPHQSPTTTTCIYRVCTVAQRANGSAARGGCESAPSRDPHVAMPTGQKAAAKHADGRAAEKAEPRARTLAFFARPAGSIRPGPRAQNRKIAKKRSFGRAPNCPFSARWRNGCWQSASKRANSCLVHIQGHRETNVRHRTRGRKQHGKYLITRLNADK